LTVIVIVVAAVFFIVIVSLRREAEAYPVVVPVDLSSTKAALQSRSIQQSSYQRKSLTRVK